MPVGTIWTPEEDERLAQLVSIHGPKKWAQIATDLGTKGSKQCRRRWKNFISLEERKQGSWTPEEDAMLLDGHMRHGNKWTLIAQEIGGRTDNAVKNRWAALEKKRRADEEPGELARRHMPVMRPQNDLLGVRRIISKDQPRYRVPQVDEAGWMEELRHDDQQPQQLPYNLRPGFIMPQYMQHTDNSQLSNSVPIRKPDLMINIPGATAAEPELPYSQRTQGTAAFAGQKELQAMELPPVQIHGEDESLLSTSRQAAQNAITALTSPSEEPGTINSLYKYLCSATPGDTQQPLPVGRRSPPPWVSGSSSSSRAMDPQQQQPQPQQQQQQQLLPPASMLHSQLPALQQQVQVQVPQYQTLPAPGGMMLPPQSQLPLIPLQSHQSQQHQQLHQMPQSASTQYMHMLQQHQQHAPSIPVSCGMVPCQQQERSYVSAQPGLSYMPPATAGMHARQHAQHGQTLAPNPVMQQQQQMQAPQLQYLSAWQQQQSYGSPSTSQQREPQYMQPAMSSAMHSGYTPQQQQMPPPQQQQQQQQLQRPDDVQKQWGPEELRQLLDLLGDQQQAGQQQQGHEQLPGLACLSGSAANLQLQGSMGMSPHIPEEEVEQVNNGHGRHVHAMSQAGVGVTGLDPVTNCYQML